MRGRSFQQTQRLNSAVDDHLYVINGTSERASTLVPWQKRSSGSNPEECGQAHVLGLVQTGTAGLGRGHRHGG